MSASSQEEFGKDLGIVHEAVITGRKVGAGKDFWKVLAHDKERFREVVEFVAARPTFNVVMDYSRSLKEMVKAGNYDWVNDDITKKHFPVKGKGKQEATVTLFHFNRAVKSDEVIAEMDKQDFQPTKIEHLLALGEKCPDLQKEFPIVALGSVWQNPNGNRNVPYLDWDSVERKLNLNWLENDWNAEYRFVAVCNIFCFPSCLGGFILWISSSRPTSCRFHLVSQRGEYIFYCLGLLFPKQSAKRILINQVLQRPESDKAVSLPCLNELL